MPKGSAIRTRDVEEAHRIHSAMLNDYVGGVFDGYNFLFRACVLEVDHVGGLLAGPDTDRASEPPNPKNSVLARILTHDFHKKTEELTVFWPLFSHDVTPLKPGEYVYVFYEDANDQQHGLWIARIPEPLTTDNANYVEGKTQFEDDGGNDGVTDFHKALCDVPDSPEDIKVPDEFVVEGGQPFVARVGDRCIEGSNNTIIVLGRDRPSDVGSGEKKESGTIDIVAGRSVADDMSFADDKSRIYVSANTNIDTNLGTKNDPGPPIDGKAAIICKSDEIRVVAREGVKIVVEGGDLHLEGANIFLGKDAVESLIQGDLFNALWKEFLPAVANHNHPSSIPNSPSPALTSYATPAKNDLANPATGPVLSPTVKVKG